MSVTFGPALPADVDAGRVFRLTCDTLGVLGDWVGHDNAHREAMAHQLVCDNDLCAGYGAQVDEVSDLPGEVNMANGNAVRVLTVLGYPADIAGELAGQDDAEAFLARALLALALAPHDEGMPAHEMVRGEQMIPGGRQIHCGWAAGDLQRRLHGLYDLAAECTATGLSIQWA